MKPEPVKKNSGKMDFIAFCRKCGRKMDNAKETIYADLNGYFGDYYCEDCMKTFTAPEKSFEPISNQKDQKERTNKMTTYDKVTYGFVVQKFNDKGHCLSQEFVAGDQVEWDDELGKHIASPGGDDEYYFPFDMYQPEEDLEDRPCGCRGNQTCLECCGKNLNDIIDREG